MLADLLDLDDTNASGTIPTEIGRLTDLRRLSMANASLEGVIPTELGQLDRLRRVQLHDNGLQGSVPTQFGNLYDLERLELHGNLLTGTMPQAICDSIIASASIYRDLSADCREVDCRECCTTCY